MCKARERDERFAALLAMAREGNEEAAHDLWLEYEFRYPADDDGSVR